MRACLAGFPWQASQETRAESACAHSDGRTDNRVGGWPIKSYEDYRKALKTSWTCWSQNIWFTKLRPERSGHVVKSWTGFFIAVFVCHYGSQRRLSGLMLIFEHAIEQMIHERGERFKMNRRNLDGDLPIPGHSPVASRLKNSLANFRFNGFPLCVIQARLRARSSHQSTPAIANP